MDSDGEHGVEVLEDKGPGVAVPVGVGVVMEPRVREPRDGAGVRRLELEAHHSLGAVGTGVAGHPGELHHAVRNKLEEPSVVRMSPALVLGLEEERDMEYRAEFLGLNPDADGLLSWDVFDAVLTPGELILMISWSDNAAAQVFDNKFTVPDGFRTRRVRVVRDYGMFDRREAPQYYPDAEGAVTIHS